MTPEQTIWLIFFLPLVSFLLIAFLTKPYPTISGYLTVLSIGLAFLLALVTFLNVLAAPHHQLLVQNYRWVMVSDLTVEVGITVDALTAVMLLVVTLVSLLVQVYSLGYMHGDPGHSRYFAYMSLFTASMLGLVLANNLIFLYVFWELVGLCSYLLIGFWFHRPAAAAAAKKAFIVTRLGDFGFLLAILAIFAHTGTFSISELFTAEKVEALTKATFLGWSLLTWVALGIFAGAVGKSAQFPLHVWLPDAMEGPTPVSALIHAATMVAAGVYLVGRLFPLFEHSVQATTAVAYIGAITAILAASMGLVVNDIKRVMAYSTISQLGYMMLSLGLGGYVAGIFHLFNHAFFKALLFLGAGSVNHTTGTFDMRYMGGLARAMPWTLWTVVMASLSLAGLPPFSGFWSKDEILAEAATKNPLLFLLALIAVFMTAFYVFRIVFMTFGGKFRGGAAAEALQQVSEGDSPWRAQDTAAAVGGSPAEEATEHGEQRLHESPPVMIAPMVVLAVLALVSGFANPPSFLTIPGVPHHWMAEFLGAPAAVAAALQRHEAPPFDLGLAGISSGVALLGIGLAYLMYGTGAISPQRVGGLLGGWPYRVLINKYGLDILYEDIIVRRILYRLVSGATDLFDRRIVDGAVNGVAGVTRGAGQALRLVETGQVQSYGLAIFLGVLAIMAAFLIQGL